MNKLHLLVAAVVGGAAVYWYIKRTCPCQHDAAPASSSSGAARVAASDEFASASAADAGGALEFAPITTNPLGGPEQSASAMAGCTSCAGSSPAAATVGAIADPVPASSSSSSFADAAPVSLSEATPIYRRTRTIAAQVGF